MAGESASGPEILFYDGDCGVCHWSVGFVARRDEAGTAFRFAPLHGDTFARKVPPEVAASLPDSIAVSTHDGRLLLRSSAMVHILRRLRGLWPALGTALWIVPKPLRDLGYDLFARVRHRLVDRPEGTCPIVPLELRRRFDP